MQISTILLTMAGLLSTQALAHNINIMAVGASITFGVSCDKTTNGNGYRGIVKSQLEQAGNTVNMIGTQHAKGTMGQGLLDQRQYEYLDPCSCSSEPSKPGYFLRAASKGRNGSPAG